MFIAAIHLATRADALATPACLNPQVSEPAKRQAPISNVLGCLRGVGSPKQKLHTPIHDIVFMTADMFDSSGNCSRMQRLPHSDGQF